MQGVSFSLSFLSFYIIRTRIPYSFLWVLGGLVCIFIKQVRVRFDDPGQRCTMARSYVHVPIETENKNTQNTNRRRTCMHMSCEKRGNDKGCSVRRSSRRWISSCLSAESARANTIVICSHARTRATSCSETCAVHTARIYVRAHGATAIRRARECRGASLSRWAAANSA